MRPVHFITTTLCCLTLPVFAETTDSDGNGVSDIWQSLYPEAAVDPEADSDGDRVSDHDEARAGSNPLDPSSAFRIQQVEIREDASGKQVILRIPAFTGKIYQVQTALEPAGRWADVGAPVPATANGILEIPLPANAAETTRFFRAVVADGDADGDGLSAWEEGVIGSSDDSPNSSGHPGGDAAAAADWLTNHHPGHHPGGPQANLREVDAAWVRLDTSGGAAGAPGGDFVTTAGTGAWHQFTSWRVAPGGGSPAQLATTQPIDGRHPQLKYLSPGNPGQPARFVSGRIRLDGNLWLSSRGLAANGNFVHFQTVGYGSNANQEVLAYDIAHAPFLTEFGVSRYVVVTAVASRLRGAPLDETRLRIITWQVNAGTGALTGVDDSGSLTNPGTFPADIVSGRPRIARIGGNRYQVTFTASNSRLRQVEVLTDDAGHIVDTSHAPNGRNIRDTDNVFINQQAAAVAGLHGVGYVTAIRETDSRLRLAVWERPQVPGGTSDQAPFLIAHNELDLTPNTNGVSLPAPVLRDSWSPQDTAGSLVGKAVASGDFNGDGRDDLITGAPNRNSGGYADSGAAYVIENGVFNQGHSQIWIQGNNGLPEIAEEGDLFGWSLAVGNFNGDAYADVAIGAPNETVHTTAFAGSVVVLYGSATGLSAAGAQSFYRTSLGQVPEELDRFGYALAAGDFNGDGRDDLAVSALNQRVGGASYAGAVHVLWGAATGLATTGSQSLDQNAAGVPDQAEPSDQFGRALAVGDFNHDGRDDLAVGIENEDLGPATDAGAVQLFHGTASGLSPGLLLSQDGFSGGGGDIHGVPESGDRFGAALTGGDFNGDGSDDLAVGVPGQAYLSAENFGAVQVVFGGMSGLSAVGEWQTDPLLGTGGTLVDDERFGSALASGDFDGDGHDDLAVGVPSKSFAGDLADAGEVDLIPGSASGMKLVKARRIHKDSVFNEYGADYPVEEVAAASDGFGEALATGDFDNDGRSDLAVGSPLRDQGSDKANAGAVHLFPDSVDYLVSFDGDEEWSPRALETVRGIVSDLGREQSGGPGAGKLYALNENIEWRHIASSTKVMTLLLAVEAIEDGVATLDDSVEVGDLAGTTGGSKLDVFLTDDSLQKKLDANNQPTPFLQPKDKMPLRLLLAAMMNQSCNRSSVAIAEHISELRTGDPLNFVMLMNQRASQLGMTQTLFGHPAGGCVTKPQDLITLQLECSKHPLFIEFGGLETYRTTEYPAAIFCGTDEAGVAKCSGAFPKFASIGAYPGRLAWKAGNTGLWHQAGEANGVPAQPPGIPWCTTSSTGIVRRLGRTLAIGLMQTGQEVGDSQNLFDHGFQKLFTPDLRAIREFPETGGIIGPEGPVRVKTFAIDHILGGLALSAVIDDHEDLRVTVWQPDTGGNALTPLGGTVRKHALQGGANFAPPEITALVPLSNSALTAEFFSANLNDERLELRLWRTGDP
jgi:hypothetical protein